MQAIVVTTVGPTGRFKAKCWRGSITGEFLTAEAAKDALLQKFWEEDGHQNHWGPTISGTLPNGDTVFVLVKNSGYVKA